MAHSLRNLPIWRDANRFLVAIEKVVKHFPKYHKYTLGSELRSNALKICNLIHQAWQEKQQQCALLYKLKYCIDEIKIQLHLAKKLEALPSFGTFEFLSKQAVNLGKQNGGGTAVFALVLKGGVKINGTFLYPSMPVFWRYLQLYLYMGYGKTKESQTQNHDWSSSPNANNSNNAWGVNFNNGNDNNNNRNNNNHARLVRGGA